jgi:IS1 family transposase
MILSALVEGNSVNSTVRLCGCSKITVLRLLADAGTFCAQFHDLYVRGLSTQRVQVDEIWSFVHSKKRNVKPKDWGKGYGDAWTWVSIDSDSKLIINWVIGGRDADYGRAFVADMADRLADRIQLTSDGWQVYLDAVSRAFGGNIDYAQLIKLYGTTKGNRGPEAKYSPGECISSEPKPITGNPNPSHINTSYVERQNLTMRMGMRRFTRLTNGFSKSLSNHAHAIALHFVHYNFVRKHMTLKTTPAVAAGLVNRAWTILDLVKMIEEEEDRIGGRITDYLPALK